MRSYSRMLHHIFWKKCQTYYTTNYKLLVDAHFNIVFPPNLTFFYVNLSFILTVSFQFNNLSFYEPDAGHLI